jgi:hypothetical protein
LAIVWHAIWFHGNAEETSSKSIQLPLLKEVFDQKLFTDFVVKVEKKRLFVHKIILAGIPYMYLGSNRAVSITTLSHVWNFAKKNCK